MNFQNITGDVRECLRESGIQEELALVNAMHISASVFIEIISGNTNKKGSICSLFEYKKKLIYSLRT